MVVVCFDPAVAAVLVEAGVPVVLAGVGAEALGRTVASCRAPSPPPDAAVPWAARICVLVGDPDNPEDQAAAMTMAAELFGPDPRVVRSAAEAREIAEECRSRPIGDPTIGVPWIAAVSSHRDT